MTDHGGRIATVESKIGSITDQQERCHRETQGVLDKLAGAVATLQATVDKHLEAERLQRASWALWEKIVLALLTTLVAPVVTLLLARALVGGGQPVAQILDALGK